MSKKLTGIPAASGIGIGKAYVLELGSFEFSAPKVNIPRYKIGEEIVRFEEALLNTKEELLDLKKTISKEMGLNHAQIFDAHLLVLEDRTLIEEVIKTIKNQRVTVEYAFSQSIKKYVEIFKKIGDEYLRERVYDIQDVARRIWKNLHRKEEKILGEIREKSILVAYDLSPSQTASLRREKVEGFVTVIGGRTSHTAILARSLGIPAVVGVGKGLSQIKTGDFLIIDGFKGKIIINPTEQELEFYKKEKQKRQRLLKRYLYTRTLIPQTKDGKIFKVAANIEFPEEIPLVLEFGAQGIGLYRTEYFYIDRKELPSEEEQYRAYREVARRLAPYDVVIRILDLGGDKFLSQVSVPEPIQSFLGWRAIRFCLAQPEIFKTQLRAILRASVEKNISLMYPMVSSVEEVIEANRILEEVKLELKREKKPFNKYIKVGAMIEVPSAALTSDIIGKYVDFFSIGTNDLIQYALAVDRSNEKVAYLYRPSHPAVLRLIKNIIDAAKLNNIKVAMCGEMASEPMFIYILVGMGLNEFSMPPSLVPRAKLLIRSIYYHDASKSAEKVLKMSYPEDVEEFCRRKLKEALGVNYEKIVRG